ncbi:MAG: hypothetical protein K8I02_11525, partial [Candidatus Methylomirabilis sp.]|nr:hypothetical protein [Deltaproteobacteria bacterium]
MKRMLLVVAGALFATALMGGRAEAQSCTNSNTICGNCGGGPTVGLLDARQALLVAVSPASNSCADDGFGDFDLNGSIGLLDARNILIHAVSPAVARPSCNPTQNTVVVRVNTAVASSFGADVTLDLPAGASADTGAPGAVSTVVDQVGTCGTGVGETQDCKIVAANTSLANQVRGGAATTQGFANDTGGVMNLRVDLGASLPAPDGTGKVILPDLSVATSALYGSDGAQLG